MRTGDTQLILGLTGGIGRAVALALSKRDIPIRALVRNKEKAMKYIQGLRNIELFEGDAANEQDVANAMQDVSVVYYCVNVPYPQWEELALKLFHNCLSNAVKNYVKLIFPGNVYVYGHARYNPVDEKHPHAAHTKKGQIRMEMEEMMALARKDKGLDYAIVRMPDFYGPFVINSFSEELYINAIKGKNLRWIGNLDAEVELIYIEDGGEAMVQVAMQEKSSGEVFNIPGSEITTARKYLTEIAKQAGSKSRPSTLNANLIFDILGVFMPMIKEVKEMLYLKREKLILDGSKFKNQFGSIPSTNYATGISQTLEWVKDFYQLK